MFLNRVQMESYSVTFRAWILSHLIDSAVVLHVGVVCLYV